MTDPAALEAEATRANALDGFFAREKRRAARRAGLPLALLARHGFRYLFRRGVVLFARVPLRTLFHVAEVVVFADFFELGYLGPLLAIRSAFVAFGAFHWGALEPLRRTVRRELARGDVHAAEWETARYLRTAVDLCVLQLFALVAWLELGPRLFHGFSIVDAYAIGCALRSMAETITRTFHAGAFAVRRVRRPFAALLAVDVVDAGTALVCWPLLGPWGFALAQLCGGAVESALTFRYVRKTYENLPISAPTLARVLSERARAPWSLVRGMLVPGVGNLIAQVDALLIAVLALGSSRSTLGLAAGLHVLRPVLSLGTSWARLFYFDLAALGGGVRRLFRVRFERLLSFAAPLFALASLAVAALIAPVLARAAPMGALLSFVPFLVVRSLFAATQIQAFARGAYRALVAGAAVVFALVAVMPRLHASGAVLLAVASAALALAAAIFRAGRATEPEDDEPLLEPLAFVGRLARTSRPISVYALALNRNGGARAASIAPLLAALPDAAFVTRYSRRTLLVASERPRSLMPALVAASAGSFERSAAFLERTDGQAALRALIDAGCLGDPPSIGADTNDTARPDEPLDTTTPRSATSPLEIAAPLDTMTPAGANTTRDVAASHDTAGELRAAFEALGGGFVLTESTGALPRGFAGPRELAHTLAELGARAAGVRPARRRGLRAAVYAPGGEAAVVFIAAHAVDAVRFAAFEQRVEWASITAVLRA